MEGTGHQHHKKDAFGISQADLDRILEKNMRKKETQIKTDIAVMAVCQTLVIIAMIVSAIMHAIS